MSYCSAVVREGLKRRAFVTLTFIRTCSASVDEKPNDDALEYMARLSINTAFAPQHCFYLSRLV